MREQPVLKLIEVDNPDVIPAVTAGGETRPGLTGQTAAAQVASIPAAEGVRHR